MGTIDNYQLNESSQQNDGSYVHPCGSIDTIQGKIASVIEESANHRVLDTHIHPTLRKYYPSNCCVEAYEHLCTGPKVHTVHRPVYNPDREKGHRRVCPVCSGSDSKRTAHKTFHELHGFKFKTMRMIDLTTPEDFIPEEIYNDKEALDKKFKLLFEYVKQFMKKEFPNESYLATMHTWHSRDPLSKPHFHPHIEASCTEYHQDKEGYLSVINKNAPKSKNDLDRMRNTWQSILGYEAEVNLHYSYAPRREKFVGKRGYGGSKRIMHRLSYCFRGFVEDVNKWLTQNDVSVLDEEQEYWLKWHLQKWPRRTRRYGAWSNSRQQQFIDMTVIEKRISNDQERTRKLYCPTCFYELEPKAQSSEPVSLDSTLLAVREIIHMNRPPSPCMYEQTPIHILNRVRYPGKNEFGGVLEYRAKNEKKRISEVTWSEV